MPDEQQPIILPLLTPAQKETVTRLMAELYHIEPLQTLENSGRTLALLAKQLLDYDIIDRPIVVLASADNHGAYGLVAARHLLNWGAWVQIVLPWSMTADTALPAQLVTLQALGAPLAWAEEGWELPPADLIIDALIGSEQPDAPAGKARDLIQLANSNRAPLLSVDLPSGVEGATGRCFTPHIQATATLCLALPVTGVVAAAAACGDLYLADTGVPPMLYTELGLDVPPLFAHDLIVPLVLTAESVTLAL